MIAYEIQLLYVIRNKSETKSSPRQNSVQEKVREKDVLSEKILLEKFVSGSQCAF